MESITAAAVSWQIREVNSHDEFLDHATSLITQAVSLGAKLIVLPESIDLERIAYHGNIPQCEIALVLAPEFPIVKSHFETLAKNHGITIVAGTHLNQRNNQYFNSALICTPQSSFLQDKNILTQWEKNEWQISNGEGLKFDPNTKLGTLICYDSEFPPASRALCEADAKIIAVPAYTETTRGHNRVRWSCHARAVECQIYIIHAALVGNLGREPISQTYGSSAIVCPSVYPFPETAILAETPLNQEGIAIAELNLTLIESARNQDDVRNWNDRDKGCWTIQSAI